MNRSAHPMLEPWKPSAADPFTPAMAAHLLNRAGFGGTPDEIEQCLKLGPAGSVEWLLDFPDAGADEQSQTDVPDLSNIDNYPKSFAERRKLFQGLTPSERQELNAKLMQANREAVFATMRWWLNRMRVGPAPLQEKLTLFWHGHFTSSARDERSAWLMWGQQETLRRHAAGNFRSFVQAVARDPAMIDYLNNQQNRKDHPNENFARELMELFTLGIGNYTEDDIKQAARAFTGWAHDGEDFIFRRNQHDTGEKKFFGQRGNFDGDDIIDIILATDTCSRYIAGKLFAFFASDAIDERLSIALGKTLKDAKYDLRPLLRTILNSRAFYAPTSMFSQIKSPIQLMVGACRQMGIDLPERGFLINQLELMGQVPLNPPNVKGWPGGRTWINTSTLFVRYNLGVRLASNINKDKLVPKDLKDAGPRALVNHWTKRLIQRPFAEEKLEVLVQQTKDAGRDGPRRLVELIVSMPEFQLC
jgi:uncharacterized protein (DUF1800 family)